MRGLSDRVRARIRSALAALADTGTTEQFVEAVVLQRAWPLGDAVAVEANTPDAGESAGAPYANHAPDAANAPGAPDTPNTPDARDIEARVADQVIRLMRESAGSELEVALAAAELADDPVLLAAFFQNLDLLPADGGARTDRIALLTMAALQQLADRIPGS